MTTEDPNGGTLLVVEDNDVARLSLATILDLEGFTVVAVANGGEALDRLRAGLAPQLVLLDMMLPVTDGWEFLRHRQADPALAAVPVVITTGLGIASPEWAAAIGATGLVRKPLDPGLLLAEVRRCLTR